MFLISEFSAFKSVVFRGLFFACSMFSFAGQLPSKLSTKHLEDFFYFAKHKNSKEEFLKALKKTRPEYFTMKNHVLNFDSSNPCGQIGAVTTDQPGPVSMNPATKITFRHFNTDVDPCDRLVEGFMRTDDRAYPYEFFKMQWKKSGELIVRTRPQSCNRCHGSPPLPIFLTGRAKVGGRVYPGNSNGIVWPTFYGMLNGQLNPDNFRGQRFLSFVDKSSHKFPYTLYGYDEYHQSSDIQSIKNDVEGHYEVPNKIALQDTADQLMAGARIRSLEAIMKRERTPVADRKAIAGIPKSCLDCHVGENAEGGDLFFDDPKALKFMLSLPNDHAFKNNILERVTEKDREFRMPPTGKPISAKELKELKVVLDSKL